MALVALIETLQKMLHEERNVFRPLFERRELNRHNAETIIKVFAKSSGPDQFAQVLVCRCNDPHINRSERVRTHSSHLLFLQNAKQFHLKAQAGLRYLVQENRAAIGGLKQAAAAGIRAGECALLMSKQLAFQNGLGKGAAVDGRKRHPGTCAVYMDGPRYKFLARSAGSAN